MKMCSSAEPKIGGCATLHLRAKFLNHFCYPLYVRHVLGKLARDHGARRVGVEVRRRRRFHIHFSGSRARTLQLANGETGSGARAFMCASELSMRME